ncbi:MAG: GNAT family N-acetyltransferase [Methanomethylovorans sp.]|jgi:ribosomal protein S18 acetylase RimI-like enzyme|nr:GNAT family N-acetyltransferase [Methanomethylovorans sp.]
MLEIEICRAGQGDYHSLCQFIELVDKEFYPPLSLRGDGIEQRVRKCLLGQYSYYLLAKNTTDIENDDASKILGVIGCNKYWKKEKDAYINIMCVHPLYRKKGISRILFQKLEYDLINQDIKKLYVCTWSTNTAAMSFYESNGFIPYCVVKDDRNHGVDTIHYRKTFHL